MAESPYSEKRHFDNMITSEMLDKLPSAWLERYEKTQKVKPRELLAEFKKVDGKDYGREMVFKFLTGLVSMILASFLYSHFFTQKEKLSTYIIRIAILLTIGLLAWWWVNRSVKAEKAQSDLVDQLEKIGDDIRTLTGLVGGERWLNDHGIKGALIRLAGEAVNKEKLLVKIAKKVGDGDLSHVYKIQTCVGNLNSKEKAYERASNLISRFVNPPYEFERAKELAKEVMEIGEPDIAEEQPLT